MDFPNIPSPISPSSWRVFLYSFYRGQASFLFTRYVLSQSFLVHWQVSGPDPVRWWFPPLTMFESTTGEKVCSLGPVYHMHLPACLVGSCPQLFDKGFRKPKNGDWNGLFHMDLTIVFIPRFRIPFFSNQCSDFQMKDLAKLSTPHISILHLIFSSASP